MHAGFARTHAVVHREGKFALAWASRRGSFPNCLGGLVPQVNRPLRAPFRPKDSTRVTNRLHILRGQAFGYAMCASLVSRAVACDNQAFAVYNGSVAESDDAGYTFDPTPNPEQLPPVVGAAVSLCPEGHCKTLSNDSGVWGPVWVGFSLARANQHVDLSIQAQGYDTFDYSAPYPDTSDPVQGQFYLNVRLHAQDAGLGDQ